MLEKHISADRGSGNRGGGTIGEQRVGWTADEKGSWMKLPAPGQRRSAMKKHCECGVTSQTPIMSGSGGCVAVKGQRTGRAEQVPSDGADFPPPPSLHAPSLPLLSLLCLASQLSVVAALGEFVGQSISLLWSISV